MRKPAQKKSPERIDRERRNRDLHADPRTLSESDLMGAAYRMRLYSNSGDRARALEDERQRRLAEDTP